MLRTILQAAIVFGISVGLFWFMPGPYLMIGVGVTAIVFLTLMLRWDEPRDEPEDMPSISLFAIEFVYRLLLAATLGVIWPSLPVIFGVQTSSKRFAARRSNTSVDQGPSSRR